MMTMMTCFCGQATRSKPEFLYKVHAMQRMAQLHKKEIGEITRGEHTLLQLRDQEWSEPTKGNRANHPWWAYAAATPRPSMVRIHKKGIGPITQARQTQAVVRPYAIQSETNTHHAKSPSRHPKRDKNTQNALSTRPRSKARQTHLMRRLCDLKPLSLSLSLSLFHIYIYIWLHVVRARLHT